MVPPQRHRYLAAMNLLLMHGALGSARQMKPLQERMGGIAIDLTGHGGREIPAGGLTFDHFIADIDRAFTEQKWKSAHLFGYSMGGYAALLYAAKHTERVESVVTLGTKFLWTEEGLQKELRKLDPDAMEAKVPAFANALAEAHGQDRWRDVVHAVAKSMRELAAAPLLTAEVCSRIECQVLLCAGDNDTTAVPHDTRMFCSGLERAKVEVLRNTRHPFDEVDLAALENVMEDFWGLAR
jgi:pimeloyl-ACP methyl ester carboxylesterase